jgi:hypothetical protein
MQPRHKMEVSGQLHPRPLYLRAESAVPIEYEFVWFSEHVWATLEESKCLATAGIGIPATSYYLYRLQYSGSYIFHASLKRDMNDLNVVRTVPHVHITIY